MLRCLQGIAGAGVELKGLGEGRPERWQGQLVLLVGLVSEQGA